MDRGGATHDGGKVARATAKTGYPLDRFFNISPDLLFVSDRKGRLIELNPAWERTLGHRAEAMRGRALSEFIHPDDRAALAERLAQRPQASSDLGISRFSHADGSYRSLECHSSGEGDLIYWAARDITEREAAEERLNESEARWRQLFENLPDALLLLDDTSGIPVIADCNAALCTVTGYSRDELIGQPILKLRPAEVTDEDVRRRAEMVREAGHLTFEIEYRRKDGSQYPIEAAVTTIRIDGRDMSLVLERDISARKAGERALHESEKRFSEFLDRVPALCFIKDQDSRLVYINRQFRETHDAADWLGKENEELWPPDEAAALTRIDQLVLDTGEQIRVEEDFLVADRMRSFLTAKFPMRGLDGNALIGAVSIDVTERKRADRALRESEARWKQLFDGSPDGMLLLDPASGELIIADCNPAICATSGYRRDDLLGQSILRLTAPGISGDDTRIRTEQVRRAGTLAFETEHRRSNGTTFSVEVSATTIKLDGREMLLTVERDISARKAAEESLREQDRMLKDAQKIARVGSWHWVAATDTITWSEEYHDIVGHDPTLPPPGYKEHLHWYTPESAARLHGAVQRAMDSGTPYELDLDLIRSDGSRLAVVARGEAVRDDSGQVTALRGTLQDITERKLIETALEESERRLRLHIENTPVAVIEWDTDFCATSWNPAAERMLGYTAEEAVGQHASMVLPEDSRALVDAVFADVLSRTGGQRSTNQNITKDGRLLDCEWFNTALTSTDGRIIGTASMGQDVTHRVAAEQALRNSEERHRSLVEASPVAMVAQRNGEILFANDAAARLLRIEDPRSLQGRKVADFTHPDNRSLIERIAAMAEGRASQLPSIEQLLLRADGDPFPAEVSAVTTIFDGGPATIAVLSDLSDRKRYEQQLRGLNEELEERVAQRTAALAEAKERAEAADRAKSALLSRASHELRTPLNSILGFAQLLALDELSGDQSESVEHILNGGSHLLVLVDEILDLARFETGRLALAPEPTDLNALVQEACGLLAPLTGERGVTIEWDHAGGVGPWVLADRQRLRQILLNLLSNAIKYNHENGAVVIRASEGNGGTLRLAVTDTGPGIAEEHLPLLFNPFERLGAEATGVQGTGLGLALSRALAEAMGGALGVESQTGAGSTFWVDLPQGTAPAAGSPAMARTDPVVVTKPPDRPRRVLYIEDNLENLRLIESLLKRWKDVTLIPAMQGRVGLDLAVDRTDLIVLDVHLPDLPGEEVLRRLKANPATRAIPVIVASADATPEQVERMVGAGALEYFTKPLDIRQFLATLSRVLGESDAGQVN